jgi:hypothetical protein
VQPGLHERRFYWNWIEPEEVMIEAHWVNENDLRNFPPTQK